MGDSAEDLVRRMVRMIKPDGVRETEPEAGDLAVFVGVGGVDMGSDASGVGRAAAGAGDGGGSDGAGAELFPSAIV